MVVEESRLSASQLAALVDGMDWLRLEARDVMRPDIVKALRPIESGRSSHATMPHVPRIRFSIQCGHHDTSASDRYRHASQS